MTKEIYIETKNLVLRSGRVEDAEILHVAVNEVWDELRQWMSWSADGAQKIEAQRDFLNKGGDGAILGFHKATGDFVIATGVHGDDGKSAETGYWVSKHYRRQGLAYEAMEAVLRYVFESTTLEALRINHADGNAASEGLIRKLGFTKTGVTSKDHLCHYDGRMLDTHHYILERQK
jgi:RimJ/RimL family protein N-acetyltransferase